MQAVEDNLLCISEAMHRACDFGAAFYLHNQMAELPPNMKTWDQTVRWVLGSVTSC